MFQSKVKWEDRPWHDKYFMTFLGIIFWIAGIIGITFQIDVLEFNSIMFFAAGTLFCIFDAIENPNLT